MEPHSWHWWLAAAVVLMIIEIFTPALVAACLGVGCLGAALAAWLGGSITTQWLVFSAISALAFWGVRPFVKKIAYPKNEKVKTNVDALKGKTGRVIVRVDNRAGGGRVLVEGDDWKALSAQDADVLEEGTSVRVIKVDSTVLTVVPLEKNS
jgi:membrane protein implicated in regulation of membrane protease activity